MYSQGRMDGRKRKRAERRNPQKKRRLADDEDEKPVTFVDVQIAQSMIKNAVMETPLEVS